VRVRVKMIAEGVGKAKAMVVGMVMEVVMMMMRVMAMGVVGVMKVRMDNTIIRASTLWLMKTAHAYTHTLPMR